MDDVSLRHISICLTSAGVSQEFETINRFYAA